MLIAARRYRGFTIIELVIGMAIVAILFTMAAPAYRSWMENSRIRGAAHSIANGLNLARTEAIHRNVPVQMQLTSAADGTAPAWIVSEVTAGTVVQMWSSADGAASTQIVQAGGGIVTFNALGRVVTPNLADGSAPLLQVDVTSSDDASDPALRSMRVLVGNGGAARMCDPQLAQPDPRAC